MASPPTTNSEPPSAPHVQGTALWRLGMEDPSLWSIWDATRPDDAIRKKLEDVPPGYDLILEGDGDIWRITATPQSGRRTFDYDADTDLFDDENFHELSALLANPADGRHARRKSRSLSTTAPIPQWTPQDSQYPETEKCSRMLFRDWRNGKSANRPREA